MRTRTNWRRGVWALALLSAACGGGGDSPTSPSPGGTAAVTIAIVAENGAQSFSPNPVVMTQGPTVAWRNADGVTHRIVANDASFDTGDIAAGATSRTLTAPTGGANYHCSIHPGMIGAIGAAQGNEPPPCTGEYCG